MGLVMGCQLSCDIDPNSQCKRLIWFIEWIDFEWAIGIHSHFEIHNQFEFKSVKSSFKCVFCVASFVCRNETAILSSVSPTAIGLCGNLFHRIFRITTIKTTCYRWHHRIRTVQAAKSINFHDSSFCVAHRFGVKAHLRLLLWRISLSLWNFSFSFLHELQFHRRWHDNLRQAKSGPHQLTQILIFDFSERPTWMRRCVPDRARERERNKPDNSTLVVTFWWAVQRRAKCSEGRERDEIKHQNLIRWITLRSAHALTVSQLRYAAR